MIEGLYWESLAKALGHIAASMLVFTVLSGPAHALGGCADPMTPNWIPTAPSVTAPTTGEIQAILDLLSRYSWALDDRDMTAFEALFTSGAVYEVCNGGGAVQVFQAISSTEIKDWVTGLLDDIPDTQLRHITGNTLLHKQGSNTVIGKSTLVVFMQPADELVPKLDYTAVLKETFTLGSDGIWRFSKLTLLVDTPGTQARAR